MTSIIITLLLVIYRIPLIHILGDKGMGYYSIALTLYLLLMTCIAYGIPKALSTIITEQSSKGQYALVYKTIKSALLYAILAGGFTAVIVFSGADIIAAYLLNVHQSSMAIRGIAPGLFFIPVIGVLHGAFIGTRALSASKLIQRIEDFSVIILSVLGAYIAKNNASIINEPIYSSTGALLVLPAPYLSPVFFL